MIMILLLLTDVHDERIHSYSEDDVTRHWTPHTIITRIIRTSGSTISSWNEFTALSNIWLFCHVFHIKTNNPPPPLRSFLRFTETTILLPPTLLFCKPSPSNPHESLIWSDAGTHSDRHQTRRADEHKLRTGISS